VKILLLNPPHENTILADNPSFIDEERGLNPPLGLLYLAAYIKQYSNHQVEVFDSAAEGISHASLAEVISKKKPDVTGITAMTFTMIDVIKAANTIRSVSKEIKVALGGPHPSIYPQETASLKEVDFVVSGEGEKIFLDLVNNINDPHRLASIKGLFFKEGGLIRGDTQEGFIEDLDSLPHPDRRLLSYRKYNSLISVKNPVTTMFTSRGCPFDCSFCYKPHLGRRFRARSAEDVVNEMQECKAIGIEEIFIYDDTFTVDKSRVIAICNEIIRRGLDIAWDIRARVDTIDNDILARLKQAGCLRIHYGVEAGTDKILRALGKGITLRQAEDAFQLTKKYGIATLAYFMIGSPVETREDIMQTISFMKRISPDYVHITLTTPFPGTKLYEKALSEGLYEKDYWREFARNPSSKVTARYWEKELKEEELLVLIKLAYRSFYFRPAYILSSLFKLRSFASARKKIRAGMKILAS